MIRVIHVHDIALNERAARFEGREHGAGLSFFLIRFPRGAGPELHRHPYDETFLVLEGQATFTVDGEQADVGPGEMVVAPAGSAHTFVSSGEVDLHMIAMNPSDHMIQEAVSG